ncbi:MAG: surface lipoprotein assembly modifier [Rickettsiales bacterium]|jgi:hypothetical protein|nr:surface lipoprotein assembly modifier [Rickettsiales bacterium]
MKKYFLIFFILSFFSAAESVAEKILLTAPQIISAANSLIEKKEFAGATQILTAGAFDDTEYEIERLYLLAKIAAAENRPEDAIVILRFILDNQPDLPKIRLELGLAYLADEQWSRADYHLRLAAAAPDLPPEAVQIIRLGINAARANKNWNAWLNIGAAPEDNINAAAAGGEECVYYLDGFGYFPYPLCRKVPRPERAIGFNLSFGGDYEFKLSDAWRLKTDAGVWANFYNLSEYDNAAISVGSGPRYIFGDGDVWLAAAAQFMTYGGDAYKKAFGLRAESTYDFTRQLSAALSLDYMRNDYFGYYADFMNGDSFSANGRAIYSITPSMYAVARAGVQREDALVAAYANWASSAALGFGAEVWLGFRIYVEAGRTWLDYDGERWVVAGGTYLPMTEHSKLSRYVLQVSNNAIDIWGFTPVLSLSLTEKDSNIPSRRYDKTGVGITMQRRF